RAPTPIRSCSPGSFKSGVRRRERHSMSETAGEREARSLAARVSLLFAALSVIIGTQLPYLPVWLDWAGLRASEIAVITGTPLIVRVAVTPIIAFAADRVGDHRKFLIGLAWLGLGGFVALGQSGSFLPILAWGLVSWLSRRPSL